MNTHKNWWAIIISLGMAFYGVAAIYGVFTSNRPGYAFGLNSLFMLIVPFLVGVAGIASFLTELTRQETTPQSKCALVIESYALAWQRLWKTKWLLWVYGGVAAIIVVSGVIGSVLTMIIRQVRMDDLVRGDVSFPMFSPEWMQSFVQNVLAILPRLTNNALGIFAQRMGHGSWGIALGVMLVLATIWAMPRLLKMRQHSRKAGFFGACLVFLMCASVFGSVMITMEYRSFLANLRAPAPITAASRPGIRQPNVTFSGARARNESSSTLGLVSELVVPSILGAMLIGGILGSLVRSKSGEGITGDSFLNDSVRNFEPLAAWYFIIGLFLLVTNLSSFMPIVSFIYMAVTVLLAFVPFTVVQRGDSFIQAVRSSLSVWKTATIPALNLIATGAFFYVLYQVAFQIIIIMFASSAWIRLAVTPITSIARVILQAVILLAIWEFYTKLQRTTTESA